MPRIHTVTVAERQGGVECVETCAAVAALAVLLETRLKVEPGPPALLPEARDPWLVVINFAIACLVQDLGWYLEYTLSIPSLCFLVFLSFCPLYSLLRSLP